MWLLAFVQVQPLKVALVIPLRDASALLALADLLQLAPQGVGRGPPSSMRHAARLDLQLLLCCYCMLSCVGLTHHWLTGQAACFQKHRMLLDAAADSCPAAWVLLLVTSGVLLCATRHVVCGRLQQQTLACAVCLREADGRLRQQLCVAVL